MKALTRAARRAPGGEHLGTPASSAGWQPAPDGGRQRLPPQPGRLPVGAILRRSRQVGPMPCPMACVPAPVGGQLDQNAGQRRTRLPGQQHRSAISAGYRRRQCYSGPGGTLTASDRPLKRLAFTGKAPEQREGQAGSGDDSQLRPPTPDRHAAGRQRQRCRMARPLGAAHQFAVGRVAFVQGVDVETPKASAPSRATRGMAGIRRCHATDFCSAECSLPPSMPELGDLARWCCGRCPAPRLDTGGRRYGQRPGSGCARRPRANTPCIRHAACQQAVDLASSAPPSR